MHIQRLDGDNWTLRAVGDLSHVPEHIRAKVFPARVPGCVHLDLIRAGVLRHPNLGYAERDQEWIGRTDWRYELRFRVDPGVPACRHASLLLDGVDTFARVELNGAFVDLPSNAFMPAFGEVTDAIVQGENVLTVTIAAPITHIEHEHARLGRLPYNGDHLGWHPFQMLRRPACSFGWDWGPRVATSGLIGSVRLTGSDDSRRCTMSPSVHPAGGGRWRINLSVGCGSTPPDKESLMLSLTRGGAVVPFVVSQAEASDRLDCSLLVDDPALWWPRGYGAPALYDLHLSMSLGGNATRHCWRIGFRTVELDTSPDEAGSAFTLKVNGVSVFCRGANWIPDALFPTEAGPARVRERVRQAADANMNMLRVWGGGAYEQDAFYDACDDLGILVWQDFMFACALYPELELLASAPVEALHQVARLAIHPSLALWCGGNECVQGYQRWGWKERLSAEQAWGKGLWCWLLPRTLRLFDRTRPYWPNSPWSGGAEWHDAAAAAVSAREIPDVQDPNHGDRHTWDLQFDDVRKIVPRFVSEFGRIAPACERTLHEAGVLDVDERPPADWPRSAPPMSPELLCALDHRLRQTGGRAVAYDPVLPDHFARPATDPRTWLWQTQVLQARALTTHIEWLRANSPRCMGALVWQLNDCWACQSWSLIDSAGRPKPAWYAVRRAFAPRLLTIQPTEIPTHTPLDAAAPLSAILINDTDEPSDSTCRIRRLTFAGLELASASAPLTAAPRSLAHLDNLLTLVGPPDDPTSEALIVEAAGERSIWFYERDRSLHLVPDAITAGLFARDGRVFVRLAARAMAHDVVIAADLLGAKARAAENCFTMLAGEERLVEIEGGELPGAWSIGELVRCAAGAAGEWRLSPGGG